MRRGVLIFLVSGLLCFALTQWIGRTPDREETPEAASPEPLASACAIVHDRLAAAGGEAFAGSVGERAVQASTGADLQARCAHLGALPESEMWAELHRWLGVERP